MLILSKYAWGFQHNAFWNALLPQQTSNIYWNIPRSSSNNKNHKSHLPTSSISRLATLVLPGKNTLPNPVLPILRLSTIQSPLASSLPASSSSDGIV